MDEEDLLATARGILEKSGESHRPLPPRDRNSTKEVVIPLE